MAKPKPKNKKAEPGMKGCRVCGLLVNARGFHNHERMHERQKKAGQNAVSDRLKVVQEFAGSPTNYEQLQRDVPLPLSNDQRDFSAAAIQSEAIEHALRQQIERTSAENGALRERVDRQEKIIRHMSGLILALLAQDE